jgi:ATP-dependent DNA ligase
VESPDRRRPQRARGPDPEETTITAAVPGLAPLGDHGGALLLDGDLVAGAGDLTDFYGLSGSLSGHRRDGGVSVVFVAFDLLVDDEPIINKPHARQGCLSQEVRCAPMP